MLHVAGKLHGYGHTELSEMLSESMKTAPLADLQKLTDQLMMLRPTPDDITEVAKNTPTTLADSIEALVSSVQSPADLWREWAALDWQTIEFLLSPSELVALADLKKQRLFALLEEATEVSDDF